MLKKRVLKLIICLIVSVSIIVQCSFSSFAKVYTYFELDSTDWVIDSKLLSSGIYPDKLPEQAKDFIPEVYRHSDLYGDYFVLSRNWDDYDIMETYDFYFPLIPDSSFGRDSFGSAVFYWNDLYFLVTDFDPAAIHIVYDYDNESFCIVNISNKASVGSVYVLSYPFESWVLTEVFSLPSNSQILPLFDYDSVNRLWSDVPVYDFVDYDYSYYYHPSDFNFLDILYTHEFYEYLSVSQGLLFIELDNSVTKKFSNKDLTFLFERFGFIVGSSTSFVHFDYDMSMYLDDKLIGTADIFEYNYQGYLSESYLDPGTAYYNTYDSRMDYSEIDLVGHELYILVTFEFASDGENLIFPGDFSVVSSTEYFENQENQALHNTISNGISSVNTTIDNGVTSIKSEIASSASAITDAVDSVNSNIEYIISGDIKVPQPDMNTEELDDLVAEQDEIIGNVISSLNDEISDFIPAGYDSYKDYLIDNIQSFKSDEYNNTFTFIRSTFDSLIANLSILPLVLFSLTFGFAVFALGRRLA